MEDLLSAIEERQPGETVALRVLRRGARPKSLEADEVLVPTDNPLAKTVIRADERAHEERQRLKRQILASQGAS